MIKEYSEKTGRYHMLVVLMERGYRNGYLGIPTKEFLRLVQNDPEFMYRIDVHGGVTYEGGDLRLIGDHGYNYIGFDCNHHGDGIDLVAMEQHGLKANEMWLSERDKNWPVRTGAYVLDELWRMIYQIRDENNMMFNFCMEKYGMDMYQDWITGSLEEDEIPEDMQLFAELNGIMY